MYVKLSLLSGSSTEEGNRAKERREEGKSDLRVDGLLLL
jgi:hypothetical protein